MLFSNSIYGIFSGPVPKVSLKSEVFGVQKEEEKSLRLLVQRNILESLNFLSVTDRYKAVTEPFQKTLN